MTKYEAYLNLYLALANAVGAMPDLADLPALVDGMNPFFLPLEGSKDIYIYQRYGELWVSHGSTYTPNTDNYGFTFAKTFFKALPKKDSRFRAGVAALDRLSQAAWEAAAQWQAISGTYELLYWLLRHSPDQSPALTAFLDRMDPFAGSATSFAKDPALAAAYFALAGQKPRFEVSYDLARAFADACGEPAVGLAFRRLREETWDQARVDTPAAFRVAPAA